MLTADFDYDLPADRIAQQPAAPGTSRLLVLDAAGPQRHRRISDLPSLLREGDLLVVNDTRVLPARLFGQALPGGAAVEILLAERHDDREWDVLARPGKRLRPGVEVSLDGEISFEVIGATQDGKRRVRFSEPIEPHLERIGHVPLPPYIKRPDDTSDRTRYQTVFAREPGAVAAPTAGLHFTQGLLDQLAAAGIERTAVTLHVGPGTFKPMTATLVHEHRMDAERFAISPAAADSVRRARREGRRVVAVGTTVVRCLEGAALLGGGEVLAGTGRTDIFITPGYPFQIVDGLLTNFHLPQSTLLLLVAAFAGGRDRVLAAYREAIAEGYRFYSYGDAMFAWRRAADSPLD